MMDGETARAVKLMQREQAARVRADLRLDVRRAMGSPAGRKLGRTGKHALSVGQAAFFNAVRTEGREVATAAGDGYWRDMARRYPHLRGGGVYDGGTSANGRMTRLGRVSQMYRDGQWWRVEPNGKMVAVPTKRRVW